ncbi:hypothetical protein KEM56_001702 [Ascosphaera pollenicola]|nr:hypothetical protein KEM56_001702 [Ascosphaera pollenicola]
MLPFDSNTPSSVGDFLASFKLDPINNSRSTKQPPPEETLVVPLSPLQKAGEYKCYNVSGSVTTQRNNQHDINDEARSNSAKDKNHLDSLSSDHLSHDIWKGGHNPSYDANDDTSIFPSQNKMTSLHSQDSSDSLRDLLNVVTAYNDVAAKEEEHRQEQLRIEEEERRLEEASSNLRKLTVNEEGRDGSSSEIPKEQQQAIDDSPELLSSHEPFSSTDSSDDEKEKKKRHRVQRNPYQRMGVQRVVGGDSQWGNDVVVGDVHYQSPDAQVVLSASGVPGSAKRTVVTTKDGGKRIVQVEIPRIDFGPTIAHDPLTTRGPLTADALTSTKERSRSEHGQGQKAPSPKGDTKAGHIHHQHRHSMLWAPGLGSVPGVNRSGDSEEHLVAMDPAQWVQQRHKQRASISLGRGSVPQPEDTAHRPASSHQVPISISGPDVSMPHVRQLLDQKETYRQPLPQELPRTPPSRPHSRQPSIATSDETRGDASTSFGRSNSSASDIAESPKRLSRGKLLGTAIYGNAHPVVRPIAHTRSATAPTVSQVPNPTNLLPQGTSLYHQRGYSTSILRATGAIDPREPREPHQQIPSPLSRCSRGASIFQDSFQPTPRENARALAATRRAVTAYGNLTASEQEYIARKTGSSFFNLSKDNAKRDLREWGGVDLGSQNFVSAIDAREKEKELFKKSHGMSYTGNVASAIAERQARLQPQRPQTSMGYLQNTAYPAYHTQGSYFPEQRPSNVVYGSPAQSVYTVGQEPAGYHSQSRPRPGQFAAAYHTHHPYAESVASLPSAYSEAFNHPASRSQPAISNGQNHHRLQLQPQQQHQQQQQQRLPQPRPNPYYHPRA